MLVARRPPEGRTIRILTALFKRRNILNILPKGYACHVVDFWETTSYVGIIPIREPSRVDRTPLPLPLPLFPPVPRLLYPPFLRGGALRFRLATPFDGPDFRPLMLLLRARAKLFELGILLGDSVFSTLR